MPWHRRHPLPRQLFGVVGAGVAVVATAGEASAANYPKAGQASPFTGDYNDPQHPGCLRQVKVVGSPLKGDGTRSPYPVIEITGYDGKGGKAACAADDRPSRADLWKIEGKMKTNTEAVVDFSPKGGPGSLKAVFENDGIVFPDGNKWTKVPVGTNDRRPKDMTTLKS